MSYAKGEAHYNSKQSRLNDKKVRTIRSMAAKGCSKCGRSTTYPVLAKMFGVSAVTIHNIVKRHTWKHIPEEDTT